MLGAPEADILATNAANGVIVPAPSFDNNFRLLQAVEDFAIKQLIAQLFREALLPVGDLRRFALSHQLFDLAKQCHNELCTKPLLRHDQAPFQTSFSQTA